jgi:aminopeptidase N
VRLADEAVQARVPLLVIGGHAETAGMLQRLGLPPVPPSLGNSGPAYAYAGRTASGRDFAVVSAPDPGSLAALARSLPHLGGQSFALFEGGRSVARGVWPSAPRMTPIDNP